MVEFLDQTTANAKDSVDAQLKKTRRELAGNITPAPDAKPLNVMTAEKMSFAPRKIEMGAAQSVAEFTRTAAKGLGTQVNNVVDRLSGVEQARQREAFRIANSGALSDEQVRVMVVARGSKSLNQMGVQWESLQKAALLGAAQVKKSGPMNEAQIEAMAKQMMETDQMKAMVKTDQSSVGSKWTVARAAGNAIVGGAVGGTVGGAAGFALAVPVKLATKLIDKVVGTHLSDTVPKAIFLGGAGLGAAALGGGGAYTIAKNAWNRYTGNDAVKDMYKAAIMQGMRNESELSPAIGRVQSSVAQAQAQVQAKEVVAAVTAEAPKSAKETVRAAQEAIAILRGVVDPDLPRLQQRLDFAERLVNGEYAKGELTGVSREQQVASLICLFTHRLGNTENDSHRNPHVNKMLEAIEQGNITAAVTAASMLKASADIKSRMDAQELTGVRPEQYNARAPSSSLDAATAQARSAGVGNATNVSTAARSFGGPVKVNLGGPKGVALN